MASSNVNTSSFQSKRNVKAIEIKGTKASLANKQLLVSTGVPTFDVILGGGLAVGSVLLVEEDNGSVYSNLLTKYYLAEGAICNHELLIANLDQDPVHQINTLPGVYDTTAIKDEKLPLKNDEEDLKIAWRYKNIESQIEVSDKFGHYFDMSKKMDVKVMENCKINYFKFLNDTESSSSSPLRKLINQIKSTIEDGNYPTSSQKKHDNILRISISSFASPLWSNSDESSSVFSSSICKFLLTLRYLMRTSYSVCLITVPPSLFQEKSAYILERFEHLCDAVIKLESFVGTPLEKEDHFKDYNGLFHVIKLPRLNSLLPNSDGDTSDLVFKVKRKRFTIEKFNLPPLFTSAEGSSPSESQSIQNSKSICQNKTSCLDSNLDF